VSESTGKGRREFLRKGAALALVPRIGAASPAPFRLAICNETFEGWSFPEACRGARAAGFTGVEIAPFTLSSDPASLSSARRGELRAIAAGEGLALVGFHSLLTAPKWLHVTTPDAALRSRSWEYVRQLVDLCVDLTENGVLVFGSGKARSTTGGSTRAEATARMEEGLARLAPHAEARGVTVVLEPLAMPSSDILNTLDETVRVVRKIASPAVSTMIDCRQTALLGPSVDVAALVASHHAYIRHVHLNERDGRHPGTGDFPFEALLASLRKASYGGWLSLEVFNFEAGGARIARETVEFIRKLEHDLDAP
jgi:D-psicose/D-tagatose/L-ribulose 3-epimerase